MKQYELNQQDWAQFIEQIARWYPKAEKITLVMDNLNTHSPGSFYETFSPTAAKASFYETFSPTAAKALWDRFEFVYTPAHGSWMNIAEIELSVLVRQCLDRRIDTLEEIRTETQAWQSRSNNAGSRIDWQFTDRDARIKLKRLYPTLNV